MVKIRLAIAFIIVCAALAVSGCSDSGGSSSSSGLASIAPPQSPVFVEATVRPEGKLKSNAEAATQAIAGTDDIASLIASKLEGSAKGNGKQLNFAQEVEPWLGKRAAVFFESFDGEDLTDFGLVLPSTDLPATQAFVDKRAETGEGSGKASYEGVDYQVESDGTAIGLIGDSLVVGEDARAFKGAVDASNGDSLADEGRYEDAIEAAVPGSLADVYLDVGALVEGGEGETSEQALSALTGAGIDSSDATAVASVMPGADQVEIELSSDLGDQEAPRGDASDLLGSLPGDSLAAFAFSGFGEQLEEAIDSLDETGVPPDLEPNELKTALRQAGIDIDKFAASLEEAGLFVSGSDEGNLGGALVMTTGDSGEVSDAISTLGVLARQAGAPGVTALSGGASGFSVRSPDLGRQPLVVATKGNRIAIGYGLEPTLQGLTADGGSTLSATGDYQAAVAALGNTPITGFVDGPAALKLADALVPSSETGFEKAKPYLRSIRFVAIGPVGGEDRATARLIVGLG